MQKYKLLQRAKILRKKATTAENILWEAIRNRKFLGLKFRRQYSIDNYIADFVCLKYKLIIELDGYHHNKKDQQKYDTIRTNILTILGFTVLRFWYHEVLINLQEVLQKIEKYIDKSALPLQEHSWRGVRQTRISVKRAGVRRKNLELTDKD